MGIPVQLILNIIKYLELSSIINFGLINRDTRDIYSNNKDYLGRLKLKEIGLKGGNLEIYTKIKCNIIKNKKIKYSNIYTFSCVYGLLNVVKFLEECGVDIPYQPLTTLTLIAENGHLQVMKYFVSKGIDVHDNDELVLHISAENGHLNIVRYIVEECGSNIHACTD